MKLLMSILTTLSLFSCSDGYYKIDSEIFSNNDRPYYTYNSESDYYSCMPWNYDKEYNAKKKYPLVVYLHYSGGAGKISYLDFLGYDKKSVFSSKDGVDFQINHPSFVLVPQTKGEWDYTKIISQIEEFKNKYRIDTNRIYLIGYSMGGSGSYSLANAYYEFNHQLFAGIIRLSGQSQTSLSDSIAQKTSVWLHVGLTDREQRVSVTREAYNNLKIQHPNAIETTGKVTIPKFSGTVLTLTVNNIEVVKKTEYNGVGHDIISLPFRDPYLINWLFHQNLENFKNR